MEWLWVAQVTVNFLFLVAIVFWWTDRGSRRTKAMEARLTMMLGQMEERAANIESQSQQTQRRMEESFGLMAAVGNHARELLQRGREELGRRVPTLEEQDLLGMTPSPDPTEERTTPDPSEDAPLGLKAVLREQLF